MHWTVEYLLNAAGKRSVRDIERQSGLSANTINRWKREDREPHIDALDKALNAIGYRISICPLEQSSPFSTEARLTKSPETSDENIPKG